MRLLEVLDFAALLSFFALLLLAFGFDFHLSRSVVRRHKGRAKFFVGISILGEIAAATGMGLTWFALFLDEPSQKVDGLLVFVPGTIACLCIILLTIENSITRFRLIDEEEDDFDD